MNPNVRVDAPGLKTDASNIREYATNYMKKIEQIYELIEANVKDGDEGNWYGPRARTFKQDINNLKPGFEAIKTDLYKASQNLEAQANTWIAFEQSS